MGGQVFNGAARPEFGLTVRISGTLEGQAINQSITSGSSPRFGGGGFHLRLADHLPASLSLRLQLFDAGGKPLSAPIPMLSTTGCNRNLDVVNLTQRTYDRLVFMPMVRR